MKEVLVAKLDKEDQEKLKELDKRTQELFDKENYLKSALRSFHEGLTIKHNLPCSKKHYIKDNAIYRAED